MQLTASEISQLRYLGSHGILWGGPEERGLPPIHTYDDMLSRWLDWGLIEHRPGRGYILSPRGEAAICKKLRQK